jgi:hypothetical protein
MPVRKFHSVEEMDPPAPRRPLDPENLRLALALAATAYGLRPWRFKPGVHKFRSVEDASKARQTAEATDSSRAVPSIKR